VADPPWMKLGEAAAEERVPLPLRAWAAWTFYAGCVDILHRLRGHSTLVAWPFHPAARTFHSAVQGNLGNRTEAAGYIHRSVRRRKI